MARQIDMQVTGTIGDLIFYESKGDFLIRTVQVQTDGTRKAATAFGRASSKARLLRTLLRPLLPAPKDKDMQNRLTTAMAKFLAGRKDANASQQENDSLTGFRFVPGPGLNDCLKFPLLFNRQADGGLTVEIPSMNPADSIVAPPGTGRVQLRLMAVAFHPDKEESVAAAPLSIDIPYSNAHQAARSVVLEMEGAAKMITVVVLELSYWNENRRIVKEGFMPVEIAGVWMSKLGNEQMCK